MADHAGEGDDDCLNCVVRGRVPKTHFFSRYRVFDALKHFFTIVFFFFFAFSHRTLNEIDDAVQDISDRNAINGVNC